MATKRPPGAESGHKFAKSLLDLHIQYPSITSDAHPSKAAHRVMKNGDEYTTQPKMPDPAEMERKDQYTSLAKNVPRSAFCLASLPTYPREPFLSSFLIFLSLLPSFYSSPCTVCSSVLSSPVDSSPPPASGGGLSVSRSSPAFAASAWGGVEGGGARLLPPLLQEQSWGVCSHQAFLLFCLALGPSDVSVHWHSNGRRLHAHVTEYRHALTHDAVLVSSWVREEPLGKHAQYQCVAVSSSGNDTSKIDLLPGSRGNGSRDEANVFSRELNDWSNALAEHDRQLQKWKQAWESCDGQGVL
ncbi:uncharacterized protein LOC118241550 [Electrophorus electricus]|uniref:uncharacterized protein LOC118241550 n=1 Tax=Electrophorus electricus TaxID=8005 RepID=UPI0015D04371|nr:uncharacterized protein LOC118241550 [Electrophorus electricus]